MSVDVGDKAPSFTLPADGGGKVSLKDFKGKTVVLYFYPEGRHLGLHGGGLRLSRRAARLLQGRWRRSSASRAIRSRATTSSRTKYELPFPLASDEDGTVCEAYGTWVEKSMYGRKYMGIERSTFLIDGKGIDPQRVAQGEGARPRRRGAESRRRR